MKLFRRVGLLLLLVRHFRRLVIALERLVVLYEADLRERDVIIPDPKLAGTKEARVEITYGPAPQVPGQALEDEYTRADFSL